MSAPARGGYAAWVSWIEAFRRGEDPPTEALGPVRGGFGSYVEARLLEKLSAAFAERVRQWQAALGGRIVAHPPDGPVSAAALLQDAIARLAPLVRLADSPLVPRPLALSMHEMLGTVREGARTALEDAWRRGLEDEHAPGMPSQRRVDPLRRPGGDRRAVLPPGRALVTPRVPDPRVRRV